MQTINLPDLTLAKLGLSKPPFRWPDAGKFKFHIATIDMPWDGYKDRQLAIAQAARYGFVRDFLAQHGAQGWVRAIGSAAVVRRMRGDVPIFDVIVNGVKLESFGMALAPRYALRLQRRGIETAITLCGIKIEGGGELPGGNPRPYVLCLDQPEMRDQIR